MVKFLTFPFGSLLLWSLQDIAIKQLIESDEKLNEINGYAQSVGGVGIVTAAEMIVTTNEFENYADANDSFLNADGSFLNGDERFLLAENKLLVVVPPADKLVRLRCYACPAYQATAIAGFGLTPAAA